MARADQLEPQTLEQATSGKLDWQRQLLGFLGAFVALVAAVVAALLYRPGLEGLFGAESFSSTASNFLTGAGAIVPLGYAFGAGMVSAVNPCGFALLPTYLGLYISSDESSGVTPRISRRLLRGLEISLVVTLSIIVLFGLVGVVLSLTTAAFAAYIRWLGLGVGVLLVLTGGALLAGRHLYLDAAQRFGDRLGSRAAQGGLRGYVAFGLAYGAGSLGCTLPIFLAVVASSFVTNGLAAAVVQFVLYALGMGFVLSVLTLVAALVKHAAFRSVRRLGAYVEPLGAVLLIVTGGYVVYYWLTLGGLLAVIGLRS